MNCSVNPFKVCIYKVNPFKVCIYKVNPFSWIIRALKNNGYNLDNCLEFYNYARTEYKDLEGYPEYI